MECFFLGVYLFPRVIIPSEDQEMAHPIAANIITGFLGSGKTTLIRHVLTHGLGKERVAVIVNEMADLGVDGQVLRGINIDKMVELSSGCICCSGILQLGVAVQEIIDTAQPAALLIETSGVAEVAPLVAELRGIGLRTDSVITLVDAENFLRTSEESEIAREQVENADFLVLNKTDLASAQGLDQTEKRLHGLNSRALIFRTRFGALETDLLFASSARRFRELADPARRLNHAHPPENGFESFVYQEPGSLDRGRFERFLKKLPHETYRSKGIVHFEEESQPSLFNYVCGRYNFDWIALDVPDPFVNQAVFIGRDLKRHRERILASLKLCRRQ